MTNADREHLEKRLKEFDYLNRQIEFADDILDTIDGCLDEIGESKAHVQTLEVFVGVKGVQRPLYFNKQQSETLKEFLDSYRCDVRKRLEEL